MTLATSPGPTSAAMPWSLWASRTAPLGLALIVVALLTAARVTGTVDSDVAWQLWIAGRMRSGAHLYRDIVEVNPPLWFWMAVPVDRLASILNVRIESGLVCSVSLFVSLSLAATDRLLHHFSKSERICLLVCSAMALAAMPWVHFGQREQLVLIGAVPYATLIAARRDGRPVSTMLAVLIGSAAAIGFALKHYFLIAPACLELWLLAAQGRSWRPRPEIVAMAAIGALYACAILFFARDFLTQIVPLVRLAYGDLRPRGVFYIFGPYAVLGLVMLGVVLARLRRIAAGQASLTKAFAISALAFALVYFVQDKGWIYHAIPMVGFGSLALVALLVETAPISQTLRLAAPVLLAFPLLLAADEQTHPALPDADLSEAIAGLDREQTVGFLAVETARPWSVTLQHQFRYPSRYMGYWMLGAVVRNERHSNSDPRLSALGRQVVADTVQDFSCLPPTRIIVVRPRDGQREFDILKFFLRDPRFSALLSHYRVRSRTTVETFERMTELPPPTAPCRPGV